MAESFGRELQMSGRALAAIMKIEDLCDYLIVTAFASGMSLNLMKLHKLVYYGEAWWLVRKGESLAGLHFEAWVHGPVNPGLSDRFRKRKRSFYMNMDPKETQPDFDAEAIPIEVREHLDTILQMYVSFSGSQLEEIVCSEQPWIAARGACGRNQRCENVIDPAVIEEFYTSLLQANTRHIPTARAQRVTR